MSVDIKTKTAMVAEAKTIKEKIDLIITCVNDYGNAEVIQSVLYDLLEEVEHLKNKIK